MFKNKEYVLTVYREKSFTKASEKLFISQPSLSASIKRIEEKIKAPIFERSSSPLKLTEIGERYVKYATEMENMEKGFCAYLSDHENLLFGKIKIGGSSLFSSFILPELVSHFKSQHPNIELEIYEDSTKNLLTKLLLGEVDVIMDNAVLDDERFVGVVYGQENLLLAIPKSFNVNQALKDKRLLAKDVCNDKHCLQNSCVSPKLFNDLPFVLLNVENDTGKRAQKILKKHKVNHKVVFRLDQQISAFNLARTGMGITFVSDLLVKKSASEQDLYFYPIKDVLATRNIYLYTKKNHYITPAIQKFLQTFSKTNN